MNININTINNNPIIDKTAVNFGGELLKDAAAPKQDMLMPVTGGDYKAFSHTTVNSGVGICNEGVENFEKELRDKALIAKENLTSLFNKLTTTDVKEIDGQTGLASINDKDADEVINVVEEIKIMLATYCEDYIPTGDVDIDAVKEIAGSAGLAAKVIKKLSKADMPVTKDNVLEVSSAVKEYGQIGEITEGAKKYLIRNNLEPTINNVYKAKHSELYKGNEKELLSSQQLQELDSQIKDIITKSGLEVNKANLKNAVMILNQGAPLTHDTLNLAQDIDRIKSYEEDEIIDLVIDNMLCKGTGKEAKLTGEPTKKEIAINNANIISHISIEDVLKVINKGLPVNVESFSDTEVKMKAEYLEENEKLYIKAYESVTRAKLCLSAGTLFTMEKLGIDTTRMTFEELTVQYEKLDEVNEVMLSVKELEASPVDVLGRFTYATSFGIAQAVNESYEVKWKLNVAGKAYDTFATAIRNDMGDNLNKAVEASAKSLLMDMNMQGSYEELVAVKILSANSIEVNRENVIKTAGDFNTISNIINNISPRMVLEMIRKGQNPLNTDINELNNYINEYNEENDISYEDFAKFLYKLECRDDITQQERADYIGLYKILNSIKKEEAKSLGIMYKGDMEITLNNMITAYISRKHSKMDKSIGENTQFTVNSEDLAYYKNIFKECKDIDMEMPDDRYYEDYVKNVKEVAYTEESIIRVLTDSEQPVTVNNVLAAMDYKASKIYKNIYELSDDTLKESIEEAFTDADTGEKLQEKIENIKANMEKYYQDIVTNDEAVSYEKLTMTASFVKNVNLLANLSKKHEYQIPLLAEEGIVSVNLKLVKNKDGGRFSITFSGEAMGNVVITGKASKNKLDTFVTTDSDEGVQRFEDMKEKLMEKIYGEGFEKQTFNISKADENQGLTGSFEGEENADTVKLYRVARMMILEIFSK